MRKLLYSTLAIAAACLATHAQAQVFVQPAPTGPLETPGSISYDFNAGAGAGLAVFDINGFTSLDGLGNCCTDIFVLSLNAIPIYSASFDLGGGGTNTVLFKPVGATESATSFGSFAGGVANLSVPLVLLGGLNTLTFDYIGVPQGIGDEAWGISNLVVTGAARDLAVPEPASWAMLLFGFALVGGAMRRQRREQRLTVSYG